MSIYRRNDLSNFRQPETRIANTLADPVTGASLATAGGAAEDLAAATANWNI
jgi:hypothetical protein